MRVMLVQAFRAHQRCVWLDLEAGATVATAIRQAAESEAFAGTNLADCPVGVHGALVEPAHRLQDGDRLEFYRPLLMQPMAARRRRADAARKRTAESP